MEEEARERVETLQVLGRELAVDEEHGVAPVDGAAFAAPAGVARLLGVIGDVDVVKVGAVDEVLEDPEPDFRG